MAVSVEYRDRVEAALSAVTPVKLRNMFGGIGIYAGAHFFAVIDDDLLYFKVDDTNRPDFEERGMGPFAPMGPDKPMQYYQVPDDVLTDPVELREWVNKAIAVAHRKSVKKKPRRPKA